jgi:hypothetical protein
VTSCTAGWLKVWSGGRLRPHTSILREDSKEGGGELGVVEPDRQGDDQNNEGKCAQGQNNRWRNGFLMSHPMARGFCDRLLEGCGFFKSLVSLVAHASILRIAVHVAGKHVHSLLDNVECSRALCMPRHLRIRIRPVFEKQPSPLDGTLLNHVV